MCSAQEIHHRSEVESQAANAFELSTTGEMFNKLAIKAYERSAADKIMNDPQNIRPPEVLYTTVEYLRDCIAD